MKNEKEIYEAFLKGYELINVASKIVIRMKDGFICDANGKRVSIDFSYPEMWETNDYWYLLRQAHKEGAIIEYKPCNERRWKVNQDPLWVEGIDYRIKEGITIKQWETHKDSIKEWWEGAQIQWSNDGSNWYNTQEPSWEEERYFRVKSKEWKMEPANWLIKSDGSYEVEYTGYVNDSQKFGMKYHSEVNVQKVVTNMRKSNLLRYWVSTLQYIEDGNCYIFINEDGDYDWDYAEIWRPSIAEIYMTEKTVEEITKALNKGELTL